jgi:hypothetical protein
MMKQARRYDMFESPSPIFYIERMELSEDVVSLLSALEAMSGGSLQRREDLGMLLELGSSPPRRSLVDELGFYARFLDRTYGIMKRIGKKGEGYERLEREFGSVLEKVSALLDALLAGGPEADVNRFRATYRVTSMGALENLLALLHDLSWYKNWLLDTERRRKGNV